MLELMMVIAVLLIVGIFAGMMFFRDEHMYLKYKCDELQESYDTIINTIDEESAPLAVIAARKWEVTVTPSYPKWYVGGEEGNTLLEAYQKACRVYAARIVNPNI